MAFSIGGVQTNGAANQEGKLDVLQTDQAGVVDKAATAEALVAQQDISTVENMVMTHSINLNAESNKALISSAKKQGETLANAARFTA